MPEVRKLNTILFADIAGYTSVMQSDEPKALLYLKIFKEKIEETVPNFNGEVIQYFGDACLLSFDSTYQGVRCAIDLQRYFQGENVPIRIGMHLGEVIFTENNVFGDGVNIASRIESMGVVGSILISKAVRDQIKNKPEFELSFVGTFDFKNVAEQIEVYAVSNSGFTVPKKESLQGKFKPKKKKSHFLTMTFAGIFLAAFVFWILKPFNNTFTEEQQQKQVTILPFENRTGLVDLDQFGEMISDYLTSGLLEISSANIVRADNIKNQVLKASLSTEDMFKLYATSGVGIVINGRYYMHDEKLFVQPNIIDTESGLVIHSPDPIVNSSSNLEIILNDLSQVILGYWAVKDFVRYQIEPPRYEAYQEYLIGLDVFDDKTEATVSHFVRANELDPNFYSPLLKLVVHYGNVGEINTRDSLLDVLATRQPTFSKWESIYFKFILARSKLDWLSAAKLAEEAAVLDPSDFIFFARGAQAYQNANYQQKAIDLITKVDSNLVGKETFQYVHGWIINSNIALKNYEKAQLTIQQYASKRPLTPFLNQKQIFSLIGTGRLSELSSVLLNYPDKGKLLYQICNFLLVNNYESEALQFAALLKEFGQGDFGRPKNHQLLGEAEMFFKNWSKAINHFETHMETNELNKMQGLDILRETLSPFGDLATCYAYNGQFNQANQLLEDVSWHFTHEAFVLYHRARIETIRGNEIDAIDFLAQAIQKGHKFSDYSYAFDHHLMPLFDNPTFQKLVAPK